MEAQIPTSKDIYIEVNGRRAAAVESYEAKAERSLYEVEQLGSELPAAILRGRARYRLALRRVRLTGTTEADFYNLAGFDVVIVKPGGRVIYSGCEWESIGESVMLGKPCIESVTLTAQRRTAL